MIDPWFRSVDGCGSGFGSLAVILWSLPLSPLEYSTVLDTSHVGSSVFSWACSDNFEYIDDDRTILTNANRATSLPRSLIHNSPNINHV